MVSTEDTIRMMREVGATDEQIAKYREFARKQLEDRNAFVAEVNKLVSFRHPAEQEVVSELWDSNQRDVQFAANVIRGRRQGAIDRRRETLRTHRWGRG